jgi:hypothetical protein
MDDYIAVKRPNFLFLKDISVKDYESIEDKYDKKISQYMDETNITYLDDTNLHCWNCSLMFDYNPIFIPTHIKETQNGELEFGIKGNMCTFNCAMQIILDQTNDGSPERWKYINNLKLLYFIKRGVHIHDIKPAPSKNNLIIYGGTWTPDILYEEIKKLDKLDTHGDIIDNSEKERANSIVDNIIHKNKIPVIFPTDDTTIYEKNKIALDQKAVLNLSSAKKIDNIYLHHLLASPNFE